MKEEIEKTIVMNLIYEVTNHIDAQTTMWLNHRRKEISEELTQNVEYNIKYLFEKGLFLIGVFKKIIPIDVKFFYKKYRLFRKFGVKGLATNNEYDGENDRFKEEIETRNT